MMQVRVFTALLLSVLMAVSDCQSSGDREISRPSPIVGEPPELAVQWSVVCPDLPTLFFVDGAHTPTHEVRQAFSSDGEADVRTEFGW